MGVWSIKLYGNDDTCDVRDTYKQALKVFDDIKAYERTTELFSEYFGSDEEPLFWYALADTQWTLGRLMPEVKEKALHFISCHGGYELYEDGYAEKWLSFLSELRDKLTSPMPPYRKIPKKKNFVSNPWNIGDIYACRLHSQSAERLGLLGKYILLQKLSDEYGAPDIIAGTDTLYSRIQVYNKVFDFLPSPEEISDLILLPLDDPLRYFDYRKKDAESIPLQLTTVVHRDGIREFNEKDFTFICNMQDKINAPIGRRNYGQLSWKILDEYICECYLLWQEYIYENKGDKFVVKKRG